MTLQFGEVILIRMHFHQAAGSKVCPALAVLDTDDDDFVAVPITSQLRHSDYDFAIKDWHAAGLNVASYVRVHKPAVLAKADILKRLALVSDRDRSSVRSLLCCAFCEVAPTS